MYKKYYFSLQYPSKNILVVLTSTCLKVLLLTPIGGNSLICRNIAIYNINWFSTIVKYDVTFEYTQGYLGETSPTRITLTKSTGNQGASSEFVLRLLSQLLVKGTSSNRKWTLEVLEPLQESFFFLKAAWSQYRGQTRHKRLQVVTISFDTYVLQPQN